MIEVLLQCFYYFGPYLILLLLGAKFVALRIYQPRNLRYVFWRLLIYHHRYVVRAEDYTRWRQYQIILNWITFTLHLSILLLLLSYFFHSPITALSD